MLAQRLARKICTDCKAPHTDRDDEVRSTWASELESAAQAPSFMKGAGCDTCNGTGYKGRVALYEVMRFTETLKEMVLQGASTAELKAAGRQGRHDHAAHGRHRRTSSGA